MLYKSIIIFGLVAYFARIIINFADDLGLFDSVVPLNIEYCTKLDDIIGAEDVTMVTDVIAVISSDDRIKLWHTESIPFENVPDGAIFSLHLKPASGKPFLKKIPLKDFPSSTVAFHPHGIYFDRASSTLYVINHAYERGSERIEIFNLLLQNADDVTLIYSHSITSPIFDNQFMGTLNDLVVLNENEFYVTQYLAFPDSIHGRTVSNNHQASISELMNILSIVLQREWCNIYYCKMKSPNKIDCQIAYDNSSTMFNGISMSQNKLNIVALDTAKGVVNILKRDEITNKLSLSHQINNIHGDNVEYDRYDIHQNSFTIGYILQQYNTMIVQDNAKYANDGEIPNGKIPGGVKRVTILENGNINIKDVIVTDGTLLSGISIGTAAKDNYYIVGSWYDEGVLVCHIPSS